LADWLAAVAGAGVGALVAAWTSPREEHAARRTREAAIEVVFSMSSMFVGWPAI
jgi:membrane associated rhomboid family serine protease